MHRTEGSNHSTNTFTNGPPGTRVEANWLNATQNEIVNTIEKANITLKTASAETGLQLYEALMTLIDPGTCMRPIFSWKDTDEIYIGAGAYIHVGTTTQKVYWNSTITFQFGSAGSNSGSADLSASDWFYVYLDDSAIVTADTTILTASEFIANTTEPTYSHTNRGWYNGSDRCIFAVRANSGSEVARFFHDGGNHILYNTYFEDLAATDVVSTWTPATLTVPSFSTRAKTMIFMASAGGSQALGYYRVYGTSTMAIPIGAIYLSNEYNRSEINVMTSSGQQIEVQSTGSATATVGVYTTGFYFPQGL